MTSRIKCSKCEIWFEGDEAYHNHLPCGVVGGAGDSEIVSEKFAKKGTGRP